MDREMVYEGQWIEIDEDGNIHLILYSDQGDGTFSRDDRMEVGAYPRGLRSTLGVCLTDPANADYEKAYEAAESYFDTVFVR